MRASIRSSQCRDSVEAADPVAGRLDAVRVVAGLTGRRVLAMRQRARLRSDVRDGNPDRIDVARGGHGQAWSKERSRRAWRCLDAHRRGVLLRDHGCIQLEQGSGAFVIAQRLSRNDGRRLS